MGVPDAEMFGMDYKDNEVAEIKKSIYEHCVYKEFVAEENKSLVDEIEDYLGDFGVIEDEDQDKFELCFLRVLGLISLGVDWFFHDKGLDKRSVRKQIPLWSNYKMDLNQPGKILPTKSVVAAIKKAEELKSLLDASLLMPYLDGLSKLDGLLDQLISVNSRVVDKNDKLKHYLFGSNKNDASLAPRLIIFRFTMCFYYVGGESMPALLKSIILYVFPKYDNSSLLRHMKEAESFAYEYCNKS